MDLAGFVGAVLAPHDGEDAEFGDVGIAAEDFLNAGVFVAGDAVFGGDFGSDFDCGLYGGHFLDEDLRVCACRSAAQARVPVPQKLLGAHAVAFAAPTRASTMERKITRPSSEFRADSTARSGCGIRPATLRSRLQMPAMLFMEPLGLPGLSSLPSGVV